MSSQRAGREWGFQSNSVKQAGAEARGAAAAGGRGGRGQSWLKNAVNLPVKFDLHFDNVTRHCIVVWRRPYWMGVRFKSVP
jgi:hypothetical protein